MGNTAIILAGGRGNRMNSQIPKQYLEVNGYPVLYYSLNIFNESPVIDSIILVTIEQDIEYCQKEIVEQYGFGKVTSIVSGGKERYDSVYNGLKHADNDGYVFIHDGARPCISLQLIEQLYDEVQTYRAVVAAVPSKDTVKISDEYGNVVSTPNRSNVWNVQTPQVFEAQLICSAYQSMYADNNRGTITDDAMVVEQYTSANVHLSMGDYCNIKVTTPEDMGLAEAFLKKDKKTENMC